MNDVTRTKDESDELTLPKCTGAPERIWLVVGDIDVDCKWGDLDEVTWCAEKQFDADIEYVHVNQLEWLLTQVAQLGEANRLLESANATLERSNQRLREKCDRLADTAMARSDR